MPPDESVHVEPGDVLGDRYRLDRRVGRGGMAEVFAATDTRLDRPVAVKVIAAHLGDDDGAGRRFEREVLAVAQVQHPNVVAVFDADVDHDRPYLVTELLAGGTLADRLRDGPLSPADAAAIGAQVAAGLAAAHEQGLVHRDVKPANVLLAADGTAKVADFGIARALDRTATVTASIHGSTPYVAPEQVRGEDADARTDVYALGCVLFEMLTGSPPYTADSPAGVIGQHLSAPVPQVAARRPAELPPVDGQLSDLVTTCLAKRAEDRPSSMDELRIALEQAATGGSAPTQRLSDATTVVVAPEPTALLDTPTPTPGPTVAMPETVAMPDPGPTVAMPDPGRTVAMPDPGSEPSRDASQPTRARPGARAALVGLLVLVAVAAAWWLRADPSTPDVTPVVEATTTPPPTSEPTDEEAAPSVAQALGDFRDHLGAGLEADQVNRGEGEKLRKDLDEVEKKHDEGKTDEAIDKVTDLQDKVGELREKDRIASSLADALDEDLDALLRALMAEA